VKTPKTKVILITLFTFLILSVVLSGCTTQPTGPATKTPTPSVTTTPSPTLQYTQDQVNLKLQWRKLWEDHVFWTRMVIINIADTPGGTNESVARLLQNYNDMEDAMRPYYGNETAEKYGDLLEDHLLIAADLVTAAKAGNSTAVASLESQWYDNADEIATLLSSINPNWNKQAEMEMWHGHLNVTLDEAVARLSKNYTADRAAYDEVHDQALMMADMQSDGILKQFPEKFPGPKTYSQSQVDLLNGMRKLWTDHTVYTRLYIISSLNDAPDTNLVAARLLRNQEDIGNAIKPVYGDAAGDQLTALLKEHIVIAVDIVDAVKAKNTTAQAAAEARWKTNADDMANFLSGANPNWPNQDLKNLLYMHLATTKDELVARYTMNYPADVKAYDTVYNHILMMSDTLANGIVQQFPAKFGK
jgi:uncharacterized protein YukE